MPLVERWPVMVTSPILCHHRYNILWSFSNDNGDDSENINKAIGLISKTTILHMQHTFLYISLPSLHEYGMKIPNFTF